MHKRIAAKSDRASKKALYWLCHYPRMMRLRGKLCTLEGRLTHQDRETLVQKLKQNPKLLKKMLIVPLETVEIAGSIIVTKQSRLLKGNDVLTFALVSETGKRVFFTKSTHPEVDKIVTSCIKNHRAKLPYPSTPLTLEDIHNGNLLQLSTETNQQKAIDKIFENIANSEPTSSFDKTIRPLLCFLTENGHNFTPLANKIRSDAHFLKALTKYSDFKGWVIQQNSTTLYGAIIQHKNNSLTIELNKMLQEKQQEREREQEREKKQPQAITRRQLALPGQGRGNQWNMYTPGANHLSQMPTRGYYDPTRPFSSTPYGF